MNMLQDSPDEPTDMELYAIRALDVLESNHQGQVELVADHNRQDQMQSDESFHDQDNLELDGSNIQTPSALELLNFDGDLIDIPSFDLHQSYLNNRISGQESMDITAVDFQRRSLQIMDERGIQIDQSSPERHFSFDLNQGFTSYQNYSNNGHYISRPLEAEPWFIPADEQFFYGQENVIQRAPEMNPEVRFMPSIPDLVHSENIIRERISLQGSFVSSGLESKKLNYMSYPVSMHTATPEAHELDSTYNSTLLQSENIIRERMSLQGSFVSSGLESKKLNYMSYPVSMHTPTPETHKLENSSLNLLQADAAQPTKLNSFKTLPKVPIRSVIASEADPIQSVLEAFIADGVATDPMPNRASMSQPEILDRLVALGLSPSPEEGLKYGEVTKKSNADKRQTVLSSNPNPPIIKKAPSSYENSGLFTKSKNRRQRCCYCFPRNKFGVSLCLFLTLTILAALAVIGYFIFPRTPSFRPSIFRSENFAENGLNVTSDPQNPSNFTATMSLVMNVTVYNPNPYSLVVNKLDLRASLQPNATVLANSGLVGTDGLTKDSIIPSTQVGYGETGKLTFPARTETNFSFNLIIQLDTNDLLTNAYLRPEIEQTCTADPSQKRTFSFSYVVNLRNNFLEAFGYVPSITSTSSVRCPLTEDQTNRIRSLLPN